MQFWLKCAGSREKPDAFASSSFSAAIKRAEAIENVIDVCCTGERWSQSHCFVGDDDGTGGGV